MHIRFRFNYKIVFFFQTLYTLYNIHYFRHELYLFPHKVIIKKNYKELSSTTPLKMITGVNIKQNSSLFDLSTEKSSVNIEKAIVHRQGQWL